MGSVKARAPCRGSSDGIGPTAAEDGVIQRRPVMKKIVVGYDASPEAERALERAAEVAKAFDADVIVTSVARILYGGGKGLAGIDPVDPPDLHEDEARRAKTRLSELGVDAKTVDGIGDPGRMIVKVAEANDAD